MDDSASGYLRTNILSNLDGTETQTGVPLALTLYVFDSENKCAAMEGVQVDIWHCNASGVYSDISSEQTLGQTYLTTDGAPLSLSRHDLSLIQR